jgi:hypothetical protein
MSVNPFPLSNDDRNQFINDVGFSALSSMPDWGSIFIWNNRVVLAFRDALGSYRLTDITMGIPNPNAPNGVLESSFLIANMPKTQTSSFGVFMYSLPQNFVDIAIEKAKAATQTIADIAQPLVFPTGIIVGIAVVVLYFVYGPHRR